MLTVKPSSSRTRLRMVSAAVRGEPNRRTLRLMSINASSMLYWNTSGENWESSSMSAWLHWA